MAPHPGISTEEFKSKAREQLLNILDTVRGKKNLVIAKALAGPINLFVKASILQEHGVDKFFFLENDNVDSTQKNIVFLARGEQAASSIAIADVLHTEIPILIALADIDFDQDQVQRLQKNSNIEHDFTLIWAPRRTLVSDKVLEETGVLGDLNIEVLPLYFIPLEDDVLSLGLDDCFRELYLDRDPTTLYIAAQALMRIQDSHGLFPRILGKGDNANRLMELLLRMRNEAAAEENTIALGPMPSAQIESLIIIDRGIDLATPMLTQLTYEGLLDEVFGIADNQADVETSVLGPLPPAQSGARTTGVVQQHAKRKIQLDSSDKLYEQLRDANFAIVDGLLNKMARRLQSDMQSRHEAKSTSELRNFVNKLPGYQAEQQSLKTHIALTEEMLKITQSDTFRQCLEIQQNLADGTDPASQHDLIEQLIARDLPLSTILRLVCLESCIAGGLRQKDLENYKRLIVQAYGYQHVLTLAALEKIGLLQTRVSAGVLFNPLGTSSGAAENSKTNYNYLRKILRLIVDEVNEQNPNDISYVYSGWAPLSIRLIQAVLQKQYLANITKPSIGANGQSISSSTSHSWQGFEPALNNIRGVTFSKTQKGEEAATKARHMLQGTSAGTDKQKTVVIMFVGGITFTEIAALRFIGRQTSEEKNGRKLLICTTGIVSGNSIMQAIIEKGDFSKS